MYLPFSNNISSWERGDQILHRAKLQAPAAGEASSASSIVGELLLVDPEQSRNSYSDLVVVLIAAIVFIGCIVSPPALMDDVDAVHGQIARNMLDSGD